MQIEAFGATHRGNKRLHNEDNIYVEGLFRNYLITDNIAITSDTDTTSHTYGVFDGMGGISFGEEASYIAALGLKKFDDEENMSDAEAYVSVIDKAICSEAQRKGVRTIGTTFVTLHIEGDKASIANMGDSRAYLFRQGKLKQLSKDHSVVQSLIDKGFLDESKRYTSKYAGEITQYLGMTSQNDKEPNPDLLTMTVLPGDIFLLCSDGLSGELTDQEISGIMLDNSNKEAKSIAETLIREVLDGPATDNVSAVVCKIGEKTL